MLSENVDQYVKCCDSYSPKYTRTIGWPVKWPPFLKKVRELPTSPLYSMGELAYGIRVGVSSLANPITLNQMHHLVECPIPQLSSTSSHSGEGGIVEQA